MQLHTTDTLLYTAYKAAEAFIKTDSVPPEMGALLPFLESLGNALPQGTKVSDEPTVDIPTMHVVGCLANCTQNAGEPYSSWGTKIAAALCDALHQDDPETFRKLAIAGMWLHYTVIKEHDYDLANQALNTPDSLAWTVIAKITEAAPTSVTSLVDKALSSLSA